MRTRTRPPFPIPPAHTTPLQSATVPFHFLTPLPQATLQLLLSIPGTKVMVGDGNQHINSFNDCCNVLDGAGLAAKLGRGQGQGQGGQCPWPQQGEAAHLQLAQQQLGQGLAHQQAQHAQQPAWQAQHAQQLSQQIQQQGPTPLRPLLELLAQYRGGRDFTLSHTFRVGRELAELANM